MNAEYLNEHLRCNRLEKEKCLEFVESLLNLVDMCMKNGLEEIMNLEDEINNNSAYNMPLMRKGANFIVYGKEPELVQNLLYNYIISSNYKGKEFLKNLIAAETLISIQLGKDIYSVIDLVSSYFGLEFYKDFEKIYNKYDEKYKITNNQIIEKYKGVKAFSEKTLILDHYLELLTQSPSLIRRIIKKCDKYCLISALRGASGEIKILFLTHMFKQQKYIMNYYISTISITDYENEIIWYQNECLNIIKKFL